MSDETEPQSESQPEETQPEVEATEEAIWESTGGGWYENSVTGERVRGKKNIPGYSEDTGDVAVTSSELVAARIMCSVCNRVSLHVNKTCQVCGEVNA